MNMNPRERSDSNALIKRSVMSKFPKVELHRHLEGSFDLRMLYKIAKRNKIAVPEPFEAFKESLQFPKSSPPDFLLFLSKFRNDWYRSHQDVYDLSYSSMKRLAQDGIHYIEIRFSPEHFSLQNDFNRMEITRLVIEAGKKAEVDSGVTIRYLITFNRSKQTQDDMLKLYKDLRGLQIPEIVGIDLAGDEVNFPPEQFKDFFKYVKDDGAYSATIHAGEVSPPSQIWTSINELFAKRIGHGTSSITDPQLQQVLISKRVALEQCITSNYQTGSWPDETTHPLGRLYRMGVPVTINSDDPHVQDFDLTDDYIKTVKNFGFSLEDLIKLNHIAIDSSFLAEPDKAMLRSSYNKAVETFRANFKL